MKNRLTVMTIILLLVLASGAVSQEIQAPNIQVSPMNQDPDPIGPGKYVEVRFKIYNDKAGTTAQDFQFMIEPIYPFSLDANENPLRDIGALPAVGDGKNVVIVKFKLRVDDKAVEGVNPVTVKYRFSDSQWISKEFDINIQTLDANLAIISVETVPEKVKPGDRATLKIKVKNKKA